MKMSRKHYERIDNGRWLFWSFVWFSGRFIFFFILGWWIFLAVAIYLGVSK